MAEVTVGISLEGEPTLKKQKVRRADVVRIGKYAHLVCNLVLPDAKRKIIGWIDLDQAVSDMSESLRNCTAEPRRSRSRFRMVLPTSATQVTNNGVRDGSIRKKKRMVLASN